MLKKRLIEFNRHIIADEEVRIFFDNNKYWNNIPAIIDLEDLEKIKYSRWHITKQGYVRDNNHKYLHNRIINFVGNPKYLVIDHINRNVLDNRKINLRIISQKQNIHNRTELSKGISGIKNINYESSRNKWRVVKYIDGKCIVKRVDSLEEAKKLIEVYKRK